MTQLEINLIMKKFKLIFRNINSMKIYKNYLLKKNSYKLINKSKDWVKNFKFIKIPKYY